MVESYAPEVDSMRDLTKEQINSLLDRLREEHLDGTRGFTVRELQEATGWGLSRARDAIRPLIQSGAVIPTWVHRGIADGYLRDGKVKGYRLVEGDKKDPSRDS